MITLAAKLVGTKFAPFLVYGVAALLVLGALWGWGQARYNAGVRDENVRAELALAEANQRFLEQKARADELAANQRLTDTIAVNRQEEELLDAIADTPDEAPDAVRVRLGCARLQREGRDTSGYPACRGLGS